MLLALQLSKACLVLDRTHVDTYETRAGSFDRVYRVVEVAKTLGLSGNHMF